MRPRFLPKPKPKPKMEPNEFDEYDREVIEENARAAAMVQFGNQPSQIFVFVPSQRLQYLHSAVTMAVDFHTHGENRPRSRL